MAEGNKAAKKAAKKKERTNCDRLESTFVDQTIRRFVHLDDLFVFWCENNEVLNIKK